MPEPAAPEQPTAALPEGGGFGAVGRVDGAMPRDDAVADEEGFPRLSGPRLRENIAIASAILLVLLLVELLLLTWFRPEEGKALWKMWVIELVAGREAGIPFAVQHADGLLVAQVSWIQDIAIAGVIYPAFLYLLARYRHRDNLVMRKLRRIEVKAQQNRHFVDRWGPLGVFAFMMVPFLVNGPLFGAALGRLSGIPTRFLILPVVAATALCSLIWTYFYRVLFQLVDPRWGPVMTGCILGGLLAWGLASEWLERRKEREARRALAGQTS